jgi:membrane protease YdiL (CAAX protease family)
VGQIALFLILLFGLTWPWGVLVVPAAMPHGQFAFLAAFLPMVWAPTAIALGILWYRGGTEVVGQELRARLRYRRGSGRWLVLAGGVPIAVTAVALAIARGVGDSAPFIPSNALLLILGIQVITGATGEELGWRGYLLPRLAKRIGALSAALVMSTLWAFWHLPAFFVPGMPHQFIPMPSFLLVVAGLGLFLALLFNEGDASVLLPMLAHLSLNVTLAVGGVNLASGVFWRTMAALYVALALVAVVRLRTQDLRQPVSA